MQMQRQRQSPPKEQPRCRKSRATISMSEVGRWLAVQLPNRPAWAPVSDEARVLVSGQAGTGRMQPSPQKPTPSRTKFRRNGNQKKKGKGEEDRSRSCRPGTRKIGCNGVMGRGEGEGTSPDGLAGEPSLATKKVSGRLGLYSAESEIRG
ncbi:hypothetical protein V2G26_003456 [Clonostachys chloroleuca]